MWPKSVSGDWMNNITKNGILSYPPYIRPVNKFAKVDIN